MICEEHRRAIWRRLDGEREKEALDAHLASCAACRAFAAKAAKLHALLPQAFAAAEPRALAPAVLARLRAAPRPPAVSERPLYAAAFAGALLVYATTDFAGFARLLFSAAALLRASARFSRSLMPAAVVQPSAWAGSLLLSPFYSMRAAADAFRSQAAVLPSAWALPLLALSVGLWIYAYYAVRRTKYQGG